MSIEAGSERMVEASDDVLADCASMSDSGLHAEFGATELEHRRLEARRAVLLATIEGRGVHLADGHRSLNGYVRATLDPGDGTVAAHRKLARLVADHPCVADALAAGRFSADHALQIGRVHVNPRTRHVLGVVVASLVADAEEQSFGEFRRNIDQLIALIDQDGAFADLAGDLERRDARLHDVGGSLEMHATGGDPITTAQLIAIFESFCEAEYRNDLATRRERHGDRAEQFPLDRTPAQRRHDALVSIFAAAAASPEGRKLPEPTVHVVIDEQSVHDALTHAHITLPDGDDVDIDADTDPDGTILTSLADELVRDPDAYRTRRCYTSTGAAIHPVVALRALLTGHVRRVVVNSRGVVVDHGTKQRLFTGLARQAALLLADICDLPGCRLPGRMCQVDHVTPWSTAGPTNQDNAGVECGPHNLHKHAAGLTVRRDERGRPYHVRPDGTIILPVGQRPPDLSFDEATERIRARLADLKRAS